MREVPYARLKHDVLVMFAILRGELPSDVDNVSHWPPELQFIWTICEECWESSPEDRISMDHVVNSLRWITDTNPGKFKSIIF